MEEHKSWFDVGRADGMANKPQRPPEARHSVRCQYNEGYAEGFRLWLDATLGPTTYASGLKPTNWPTKTE